MIYLFIAIGGGLGALLRYIVTSQMTLWLGKDFPYGTLTVNLIGSFLLGLALAYSQQLPDNSHTFLKGFFMVGLLGALTTFSTFSLDTVVLLQAGDYLKALMNIIFNLVCCIGMTWLAIYLMKG